MTSLAKQITFCNGNNVHSQYPLHFLLTSLHGAADSSSIYSSETIRVNQLTQHELEQEQKQEQEKEKETEKEKEKEKTHATSTAPENDRSALTASAEKTFHPRTILSRVAGYEKWVIHETSKHFLHLFEPFLAENYTRTQSTTSSSIIPHPLPSAPLKIVYLIAESNNVLTQLDDSSVYVIGGIVDHNRLKGHCANLCENLKLETARLPLPEYMKVDKRTVITINQVFEILLEAFQQQKIQQEDNRHMTDDNSSSSSSCTVDWAAVFKKVLPSRSNWQEKSEETNDEVEATTQKSTS